eukprot:14854902-Alexandrium_andersonii.AAC.1
MTGWTVTRMAIVAHFALALTSMAAGRNLNADTPSITLALPATGPTTAQPAAAPSAAPQSER